MSLKRWVRVDDGKCGAIVRASREDGIRLDRQRGTEKDRCPCQASRSLGVSVRTSDSQELIGDLRPLLRVPPTSSIPDVGA